MQFNSEFVSKRYVYRYMIIKCIWFKLYSEGYKYMLKKVNYKEEYIL